MEFEKQFIEGVWVITPKRFGDARGYFSETFKKSEFEAHVGKVEFVQDNESRPMECCADCTFRKASSARQNL